MKVVFIHPDFMKGAQGKYYEGIASLSAVLKGSGHKVELFHMVKKISGPEFAEIFEKHYSNADIAAFSSTTNVFPYVTRYAREIKKRHNIPVICGGAHPTLCPEKSIKADGIDMICRGEGEYAMSELCDRLEKKQNIDDIQGLWIKSGKNILKNTVRAFPANLDLLPMPDRGIFDYKNSVDYNWNRLTFMASRGCPFDCSYCCSNRIREIYPNRSGYTRFKNPRRLLEEIKHSLAGRGNVRLIVFHDDILTLEKKWFKNFIFEYAEKINLPYICNSRFDLIDEEIVRTLKKTNCVGIKFGLESGDDFIRRKILARQQNRKDIIRVSEMCRRAGLRIYTFNMVGIPFEKLTKVLKTIKLNAALKPYDMQVSIFYPYPTTDLYEICKKEKFLTNKSLQGYLEGDTTLRLRDFPENEIIFAYDNFACFVRYYEFALFFPKKIRIFFIKIFDFLWNHPKIYRYAKPDLAIIRCFTGLLTRGFR